MNSYNHYAYGAIADWMYGVMAGIKTDENAPSYENIILEPIADKRLSYVKTLVDTKKGTVKSCWEIQGDNIIYNFTVPEKSTADIIIDGNTHKVGGGEYTFKSKI